MNQNLATPDTHGIGASVPLPDRENTRTFSNAEPLLRVEGLSKEYAGNSKSGRGALRLFDGLDLEVQRSELVAIVGQSGSGKSTLLHMLGALDAPSAGTIYCATTQVTKLSTKEAARFRNEQVGYVWQFHYLLPEFTAQEN